MFAELHLLASSAAEKLSFQEEPSSEGVLALYETMQHLRHAYNLYSACNVSSRSCSLLCTTASQRAEDSGMLSCPQGAVLYLLGKIVSFRISTLTVMKWLISDQSSHGETSREAE